MGGEGAMMAANNSLKANRCLLSKRKERKALNGSYAGIKLKEYPKATQEQLDTIRRNITKERKKRLTITLVLFTVVLLMLALLSQYIVPYFSPIARAISG